MAPVAEGRKRPPDREGPGADALGVPSAGLSLGGLLASSARVRFARHRCDSKPHTRRPVESKTRIMTTRTRVANEGLFSVQTMGATSVQLTSQSRFRIYITCHVLRCPLRAGNTSLFESLC